MQALEKMGTDQPTNLGEMNMAPTSVVHRFAALTGENLGHLTLKLSIPIRKFIEISEIGNRQTITESKKYKDEFVAQRPLIREHAVNLGKYTLMGLVSAEINSMRASGRDIPDEVIRLQAQLGKPPYACLQPIVANIRSCKPDGSDISIEQIPNAPEVLIVNLQAAHILWVIDGQHRRHGFELVMDFLRSVTRTYKYPKRGLFYPTDYNDEPISESLCGFWNAIMDSAMSRSTVGVEVHIGLNMEQEQQLFFDLNQKGRKVPSSLAYAYDHTDPVNVFVKEKLIDEEVLPFSPKDADNSDWHADDGILARKDVNTITSFLFVGKGSSKGTTPELINSRSDFAETFWSLVKKIPGFGETGAKPTTVAAQPVVLKGLAKLAHDLAYGNTSLRDPDALNVVYDAIRDGTLSFSHNNEVWRALFMSSDERIRNFPGIEKYVFVPNGTNLDAGTYDDENDWVRFGSRHNDILQRIGDIIRFQLSLSPRKSVTNAIEREKRQIELEKVLEDL